MPANFIARLRDYYRDVGKVLRGESQAASIFPNPTDKGITREDVYLEFLQQHAPPKCRVFMGGFLFDETGAESRQTDIIITTDTAPRFDVRKIGGKSFSPVEGTLAVFSVKSNLDKSELFDSLDGMASIPPTMPIGNRIPFMLQLPNYDDWPLKVIFAYNGIAPETLLDHLDDFYAAKPGIPLTRRPNFIHVAGRYFIARPTGSMALTNPGGDIALLEAGKYHAVITEPDIQAIVWTLHELQSRASASTHILFNYAGLLNKVIGVPATHQRPQGPPVESIDVYTTWEGIE